MFDRCSRLALAAAVVVASASSADALTHAKSLKFPLIPYFTECGGEQDYANCSLGNTNNATANLAGPRWAYDDATLEITDDGKVALRVDNLRPRSGTCPSSNACMCSNDNGACTISSTCGTGNTCMAPAGFEIEVEIWGQNFVKNHVALPAPCNSSSCLRRSVDGTGGNGDCHKTFTFTTPNYGGDIDSSTAVGSWSCNGYLSLGPGEIRSVEVRIVDPDLSGGAPELLGVMGYGQW